MIKFIVPKWYVSASVCVILYIFSPVSFQAHTHTQKKKKTQMSNTPGNTLIKLKKIKYKEKGIKSSKGKAAKINQGIPIRQSIFQQKLCRPEGSSRIY